MSTERFPGTVLGFVEHRYHARGGIWIWSTNNRSVHTGHSGQMTAKHRLGGNIEAEAVERVPRV